MEKNEIKFARIYESVHHMNHFNWNLSRDCCWGAHEVQQKNVTKELVYERKFRIIYYEVLLFRMLQKWDEIILLSHGFLDIEISHLI